MNSFRASFTPADEFTFESDRGSPMSEFDAVAAWRNPHVVFCVVTTEYPVVRPKSPASYAGVVLPTVDSPARDL